MPKDISQRLLNRGAGSTSERALGQKKQNIEEYNEAVSGPPERPKANPPQEVNKITHTEKYGSRPGEIRTPTDRFTQPLGSFKHGTDYVPETGLYKLHEGEKVTPKEENMAATNSADVMAMIPGRAAKKPAKVLDHIRIKSHKDGSHTVTHHHTHPEYHPAEEHGLSNMDALHSHLEDHVGQPNSGEAEADSGNPEAYSGGAPAAPAAPAQE